MSSAKFYSIRSCNDDYVPSEFRVTRSTCEPNELEKKNFSNENRACISQYPDANIQFREVKVVIPWLPDARFETDARFIPDARLEALDAKLEAMYADYEKRLNGSEDDIIRPDFDDNTQMILEYVEKNKFTNMSIAEAVDYLKCCHHCGNTEIPFGDEYCNERCQDYSIVYNYPCFRGPDCKACDNYYRHNTCINYHYEEVAEEDLVYDDSGEMTPRGRVIKIDKKDVNWTDDEEYDDDRNIESTIWDIQDQERENYEEMILQMAEEAEAEEDEW